MRRSKEDSLKTRQSILLAARRVFARRGVSQTSIEHVARAAGVTRGAVYGHFKGKDALFQCMREQVRRARAVQQLRFGATAPALNSRMNSRQIRRFCGLDKECQTMMQNAMETLGLSARAHDRILRMARTIADIEGSESIREGHLSEAIGYRSLDRRLWAR